MDAFIVLVTAFLVSMPLWIFFNKKYTFEEFVWVVFRIIWVSLILFGLLLLVLEIFFGILEIEFNLKNPFEKTTPLISLAVLSLLIVVFVNWRLNFKDKNQNK